MACVQLPIDMLIGFLRYHGFNAVRLPISRTFVEAMSNNKANTQYFVDTGASANGVVSCRVRHHRWCALVCPAELNGKDLRTQLRYIIDRFAAQGILVMLDVHRYDSWVVNDNVSVCSTAGHRDRERKGRGGGERQRQRGRKRPHLTQSLRSWNGTGSRRQRLGQGDGRPLDHGARQVERLRARPDERAALPVVRG